MAEVSNQELAVFDLPSVLSSDNLEAIIEEIMARRDSDLMINAAEVERIDTPCVEALIAAANLWAKDDRPLTYTEKSPQFQSALEILGIDMSSLEHGAN